MKKHVTDRIIKNLKKKHPGETARIKTGVGQAAKFWTKKDGSEQDFENFCLNNFFAGRELEILLERFEEKFEYIGGHFIALMLKIRREFDEDLGDLHPVDNFFASYSPNAHFKDDMFKTKLAFIVLLNFKLKNLDECLKEGAGWSRKEWAKTRLAQTFSSRVPSEVYQEISDAARKAEGYIASYQIDMGQIVGKDSKPLFRKGLKLISHWGLRDELRGLYSSPDNLEKQRAIYKIMERIISQELPPEITRKSSHKYDPFGNILDGKKARGENDERYSHMLNNFRAHLREDGYYPMHPTLPDRKFNLERQIPEKEVEKLFTSVLSSPESRETAELIRKRLGRNLEPFDIWYDGFKSRSSMDTETLDNIVRKQFPNLEAFEKKIPHILWKLGFSKETVKYLAEKIEVDPARGSGHAWGAGMRGEKAHLRTRVPRGGMDYQGFNTAMHELGHCVEQTFSLYKVDHTLLEGVPNTAFTEGFAFVFQDRDLDILGMPSRDRNAAHLKTLDTFWSTREIAGVALVDMRIWRWLYKNKKANAAQLKNQTIKTAKEVWNRYFYPSFGVKDFPVLAIYSHMINHVLYLPDYPLGYIISFQVEEYFKGKSLAMEMERMCRLGSITPKEWMRRALRKEISARPMIEAVAGALNALKKIPVRA